MHTAIPFALHLTPGIISTNEDVIDPEPKAKRGRKPNVIRNPQSHLIRMAISNGMPFIENAVMAALYIAVGASNGTLNARPRHLRKVICFDIISKETLISRLISNHGKPISARTARYLVAAARLALGGIERHLRCNPALASRLQAEWDRAQSDGDADGYYLDELQTGYLISQSEWQHQNAA